jgi:hypothetical protein
MIYLLDLNGTLAAKYEPQIKSMTERINRETYRQELVDRLALERVFLVTARPATYARATMHSIGTKTGWLPERYYFNEEGLPPPKMKPRLVKELRKEMPGEEFFAIDSNPLTRREYEKVGVSAVPWDEFLSVK